MRKNWFLLGDIHGETAPIEYFYIHNKARLELDECENHLILLGDVGCNFCITGERDADFKRCLSKMPFTYICLRGNHEARVKDVADRYPERWETVSKYGGTVFVEKEFPRIEYLLDGPAIYEFAGYKTMAVPGAYSVDKFLRLRRGYQWFENEQLSEAEMEQGMEIAKAEKSVDLIISHTCPIAFEPRDLFLRSIDQSQVDKTMEMYLQEIESMLDYRRFAWGHYHADRLYPWDGDKEKLMLFNEHVVDLVRFMEMKRSDYLEDILA